MSVYSRDHYTCLLLHHNIPVVFKSNNTIVTYYSGIMVPTTFDSDMPSVCLSIAAATGSRHLVSSRKLHIASTSTFNHFQLCFVKSVIKTRLNHTERNLKMNVAAEWVTCFANCHIHPVGGALSSYSSTRGLFIPYLSSSCGTLSSAL